jgi:hypothetical protein
MNFDPQQSYSWTVLSATSITGFASSSQLLIDSSLLGLPSANFGFSVMSGALGQNLVLNFSAIPEPSTYAMIGLGLLVVGYVARRRRKN